MTMLRINKIMTFRWKQILMGKCIPSNNKKSNKVESKVNKNLQTKKWAMLTNNKNRRT